MHIQPKTVVTMEYSLKDDKGELIDSSEGREPLTFLHGAGNVAPGLEAALVGKSTGDAVEVTVSPDEAYGPRDETLVRNLPIRKLSDKNPQVGRRYRAQLDDGMAFVLVTEVKGDYATIDGNHPLAGMTLHFSVKISNVREATAEELQHGHVHGEGGNHH